MVDYFLIAAGVMALLAVIVVYRIVKSLLKVLVLALAIGTVLLGAFAFMVVGDYEDIQQRLNTEKNLMMLIDEDKIVTGIIVEGSKTTTADEEQVNSAIEGLKSGEFSDEYFKVVLFNQSITQESRIKQLGIDEELLESGTPDERAQEFSIIVKETLGDPLFFATQYKKGNIQVFEETATFTALKWIPMKTISKLLGKAADKSKEVVKEVPEKKESLLKKAQNLY
ncbi:hypothetical protein HYX10_06055 [Candidatus Woesearchaeota archaeon]|nr:hypothetical protein [Candidatus Woesearchaeota archaeon]